MPQKTSQPENPVTDSTCVRVVENPESHAERLNELRHEALANDHLVALAAFMSTSGNETRLRILFTLWRAGELCVCDIADMFDITQPSVSRHLKLLREKALVQSRRDAQTIYYSVCTDNPFARLLIALFAEQESEKIALSLNGEALV